MQDKKWIRDYKRLLVTIQTLKKERDALTKRISETNKVRKELHDLLVEGKVYGGN
jgi:chaperonin cofactor prefoldin